MLQAIVDCSDYEAVLTFKNEFALIFGKDIAIYTK